VRKSSIVNVKSSVGETTFDEAYEARKLDRYLTGIPHLFHSVVGEDLTHSIEDFLTANRIDFLAMLPREHTFLEKLFLKSETRKVVLHTQTPLLSLRV
jgi:nucleotide-binding universal stress UspA family protein